MLIKISKSFITVWTIIWILSICIIFIGGSELCFVSNNLPVHQCESKLLLFSLAVITNNSKELNKQIIWNSSIVSDWKLERINKAYSTFIRSNSHLKYSKFG